MVNLSTHDLASVINNTHSAYELLTQDGEYFLPEENFCGLLWMADIIGGSKKVRTFTFDSDLTF